MKIREIILDFTSLLDVVMIILFFFILFSTFEVESAAQSAEETKTAYETMQEELEQEKEAWRKQADAEWDRILSIDENAADNQQALLAYNQGAIIAFNLQDVERNDIWSLHVLSGNVRIGSIDAADRDSLAQKIIALLDKAGLETDDVIISTLTYDGDALGTDGAVPVVERAIQEIQTEYTDLYFTKINVSK